MADLQKVTNHVTAPLSLFSAIICGSAVIASYIFPQQRKFPNVVLVWTCIADFVAALYIAMMLLPGPFRDNYIYEIPNNSTFCTLSIYTLWAIQLSASMLGLLLAYTLYATIVKKIDLEESSMYYYGYIAVFWIPTILLPCVYLFAAGHRFTLSICDTTSKIGIGFRVGSWFILLCIQVFLLIKVFRVVKKVTGAVQHNSSNVSNMSNALFWLTMRCLGAQFNQVVTWFPQVIIELIGLWDGQASQSLLIFSAITPCFLFTNGFIVLAGNKPLKTYLASLFIGYFKHQ